MLQHVWQQKLDTKFHKEASNWSRVADHRNKQFFEVIPYDKPTVYISELFREGRIILDQDEMLSYTQAFYQNLYSAPPETEEFLEARAQCLASVLCKVIEEQNNHLIAPLTLQELHDAVQDTKIKYDTYKVS